MTTTKIWQIAVQAFVASLLGACAGGGGGGGGSVPVSPPPPMFPPLAPPHAHGDFPSPSSSEYTASWGVAGTNAAIAWQNNATGAGVEVAVIDDGLEFDHPEFTGRVSPDSTDIVSGRNQLSNSQTHGTEVASIIVGNYNNSQTVGLAFDATVLGIRADDRAGDGEFSSTDLTNAIDYARTHGARVINLSIGGSTPLPSSFTTALSQATGAGIIFTISAGNEGGSNGGATQPDYPAFYATTPSISHGLILIAGGLNSDGSVNSFSNPPGAAADWYLTAPGWEIVVPDFGAPGGDPHFQLCGLGASHNLCEVQGTSYAAPQLAGAVALLLQAFPGMTPAEIVDLLLTTADDTGPIGTDSVNGRGRLNIGRAFEPVGPLAVPLAQGAVTLTAGTPMGVVGPAFGDAFSRGDAWSVAGFDSFNRTFSVNLGLGWMRAPAGPSAIAEAPALWRTAQTSAGVTVQVALADDVAPESYHLPIDREDLQQISARIEADLGGGLSLAFASNDASAIRDDTSGASGLLGLVDARQSLMLTQHLTKSISLSVFEANGEAPVGLEQSLAQRSATGIRTSFAAPIGALDLTYGIVAEQGSLLGLSWADVFGGEPNSDASFVSVGGRFSPASGWRLRFEGEYGSADIAGASWLSVSSPLRTTAFSVTAEFDGVPVWLRDAGGSGMLTLSVSQPLRVESGSLSFMAPTATNYGRRSLSYVRRDFDPTPSGRELRFDLGYRYFAGDKISAFGDIMYVLEPGHVANADPEGIAEVGIRFAN